MESNFIRNINLVLVFSRDGPNFEWKKYCHTPKIKCIQIASLHLKLYAVIVEFAVFAVNVAHAVVNHTTVPTDAHSVHKYGGIEKKNLEKIDFFCK